MILCKTAKCISQRLTNAYEEKMLAFKKYDIAVCCTGDNMIILDGSDSKCDVCQYLSTS
jgi:hypothetical protein